MFSSIFSTFEATGSRVSASGTCKSQSWLSPKYSDFSTGISSVAYLSLMPYVTVCWSADASKSTSFDISSFPDLSKALYASPRSISINIPRSKRSKKISLRSLDRIWTKAFAPNTCRCKTLRLRLWFKSYGFSALCCYLSSSIAHVVGVINGLSPKSFWKAGNSTQQCGTCHLKNCPIEALCPSIGIRRVGNREFMADSTCP